MAKKKTEVFVNGKKIPDTFQAQVMIRFMTQAEMDAFWVKYQGAHVKEKSTKPPTELQYEMAKMRKTMPAKAVAAAKGVDQFVVLKAVHKVAVWAFLNS